MTSEITGMTNLVVSQNLTNTDKAKNKSESVDVVNEQNGDVSSPDYNVFISDEARAAAAQGRDGEPGGSNGGGNEPPFTGG